MSLGPWHRLARAASRLGVRRAAIVAAPEAPRAGATVLGPPYARGLASGSAGEVQAILIEGVEGLGSARDIVAVRAGYLRNCLYPTKKAVYATRANLQRYGLIAEEAALGAQQEQQQQQIGGEGPAAGEELDANASSQHPFAEKILTKLSQSTVVWPSCAQPHLLVRACILSCRVGDYPRRA